MLIKSQSLFQNDIGRSFGGPVHSRARFRASSFANFYYGNSAVSGETEKAGIPVSGSAPYLFTLPPKAGGLSSHNNTSITTAPTAAIAGGLPGSGASTITFSATGTGGLIVSGSGSSTISFSPTATIVSIVSGSGSATVTFSPTATIGADAFLTGSTTVSFTGSMQSYAVGYLSGTATNETEFSADALARAVWDAVASDFNLAGSMGEKLNDAGSAGNPWASLLASNNSAGSFGEFVQALPSAMAISTELLDSSDVETGVTVKEALRIVLAALSGKISGAGTNTITIRDINDTTDRITATVDTNGNRTAVTVDGS